MPPAVQLISYYQNEYLMMNIGSTDVTVDGIAMTTSVKSQLMSSDGTVDIIELKRRIERKEAEVKRKDREIGNLQRDLQMSQKEKKDLQSENENLTRSLSNARMLNASVLDDSVQVCPAFGMLTP